MPDDLIDRQPDYARRYDLRGWEALVHEVFTRTVLVQRIPAEGMIVELGTARALNFQRLCALFGPGRCRGYDVTNVTGHPRVVEADVRALGPEHDVEIAMGWNDLSDWEVSPASKEAGRRFLLRNLIPGGLYVDAGFTEAAPAPAELPGMERLAEDRGVVVWRRPGSPRPVDRVTPDRAWWQWLDRMLQLDPWPCHLRRPRHDTNLHRGAARWAAGAAELDGRLRWRGAGAWSHRVPWPAATWGRVLFAGAESHALHLLGRGQALECGLEPGDALVIPPGWEAQRATSSGSPLWCLEFEHQPPGRWLR